MRGRSALLVLWLFVLGVLVGAPAPALAGWSQSGQGQSGTGGITLPAGDLSGTGSTNANPTISGLTGSSNLVTASGGGNPTAIAFTGASSPAAASGLLRFPNNVAALAARNPGNTGDMPILKTDASANIIIGDSSGSNLDTVQVFGGNTGQFIVVTSSNIQLASTGTLFFTGPTYLIRDNNAATTWTWTPNGTGSSTFQLAAGTTATFNQAQSTTGAGVTTTYQAQAAKTGSGAAGGDIIVASGAGDGAGAAGTVHIRGGATDEQQFLPWSGTVNSQAQSYVQQGFTCEVTTATAATCGGATIGVASAHCTTFVVYWNAKVKNSGANGQSNQTTCTACNNAGTVTSTTAANAYAANQAIGTVCTSGTPAITCTASGANELIQVSGCANATGVDYQLIVDESAN